MKKINTQEEWIDRAKEVLPAAGFGNSAGVSGAPGGSAGSLGGINGSSVGQGGSSGSSVYRSDIMSQGSNSHNPGSDGYAILYYKTP